jgi:hypothetical protein
MRRRLRSRAIAEGTRGFSRRAGAFLFGDENLEMGAGLAGGDDPTTAAATAVLLFGRGLEYD